MQPALLVRFRPTGPWRFGPESGARDRVDSVCHSDTLYSAVTAAMQQLGFLEDWFAATVSTASVRISSLFPCHGDTLFVPVPKGLWPPPSAPSRVRWAGAQFIPTQVMETLLNSQNIEEDRWLVDGPSGCLVASGGRFRGNGPFRVALRTAAAVDRWNAGVAPHRTACLEFAEEAGYWGVAVFQSAEDAASWGTRLRSAFRWLADTGIGGERSLGWGRSDSPTFREGTLVNLLFRNFPISEEPANARWLLSLYSPAPEDPVDWQQGCYSVLVRAGRAWSPSRSGDLKRSVRFVAEGSVLAASGELNGSVRDVAPSGFPHPLYAFGRAVSLPVRLKKPAATSLPSIETQTAPKPESEPVETTEATAISPAESEAPPEPDAEVTR